MSAANSVKLIGNVVRDVETKYANSGTAIGQMTIAVNRNRKNESGEYESDFFDLVTFGKTAEYVSNYITKGKKVAIEGVLQQRSWVDQQSGQKRYKIEVIVNDITSLSPRDPEDHAVSVVTTPTQEDDDLDATDPFAEDS